jgi:hypothetical protein
MASHARCLLHCLFTAPEALLQPALGDSQRWAAGPPHTQQAAEDFKGIMQVGKPIDVLSGRSYSVAWMVGYWHSWL